MSKKRKRRNFLSSSSDDSDETTDDEDYVVSSSDEDEGEEGTDISNKEHSSHRYNLRKRYDLGNVVCKIITDAVEEACRDEVTQFNQEESKKKKKHVTQLPFNPTTWNDLMKLMRLCADKSNVGYIDCEDLAKLREPMEEIDALVGMVSVKQVLTFRIIRYLQRSYFQNRGLDHIVITGPAGCGKTSLGIIIAKLLAKMGRTKGGEVVVGTRKNLIGSFLGQTSKQTQAVIDEAIKKSGVLLIDEAYQLSDGRGSDSGDSFSKACIDTLNQNLSENSDKLVCMLIGYKDSLNRDFFSQNQGLRRRFTVWLHLEPYSPMELATIFLSQLVGQGLQTALKVERVTEMFSLYKDVCFKDHGGSVTNLVEEIKRKHCLRVFGSLKNEKGVIIEDDVRKGLDSIKTTIESNLPKPNHPPPFMYV